MTSKIRRSVVIVLGVLVGALAFLNGYQFVKPIDTTPILPDKPATEVQALPAIDLAAVSITAERVSETLRRPLFTEGRRPRDSDASNSSDANPIQRDASVLKFVGTMQWGNSHKALIRVAAEPFARWIFVGDSVGGWTLKQIDRDFIIVEQRSDQVKIPIVANASAPSIETAPD